MIVSIAVLRSCERARSFESRDARREVAVLFLLS